MRLLLRDANVPHAKVDFDELRACHPRPADDDGWGTRLGLANLAALWKNYQAAGARRLLMASVIETRAQLDGIRQAVPGADILVVRLRASPASLLARVRQRPALGIEWDLDRALELASLMDAARVEDLLVDTEGRDPTGIARDILVQVGWLSA
jgi:hypothetical protein